MFSRIVRVQLAVFAVLTVVVVTWTALNYVNLPQFFGWGRYQLSVDLPTTHGLYPNASVTYRGVEIGRVVDVGLTDSGVRAEIQVDKEVRLPSDVTAQVHSRSPAGDQYLDFTPGAGTGSRTLAEGDVVPESRTRGPVPARRLLDNANRFVASMPGDSLETTIQEFGRMFQGTGPHLRSLLDSSRTLLQAAQGNIDPTLSLIYGAQPFLATQRDSGPDIQRFARDFASFTDQLALSDAQIRTMFAATPGFRKEMGALATELRPVLPSLLAHSAAFGDVLRVYEDNLRAALIWVPKTAALWQSCYLNEAEYDACRAGLRVMYNNPPVCTKGYMPQTERRHPDDLRWREPPDSVYCKEPHDSPIQVRGIRNSVCPNNHAIRAALASGCGLDFTKPVVPHGRASATAYDPNLGRPVALGEALYYSKSHGVRDPAPGGVRSLLSLPLNPRR